MCNLSLECKSKCSMQKSIKVVHQINSLKKKKHMIIFICAEKKIIEMCIQKSKILKNLWDII